MSKEQLAKYPYVESEMLSMAKVAKYFQIETDKLVQLLIKLEWIEKQNRWIVLLAPGEAVAGIQKYNMKTKTKYIMWHHTIQNNPVLIETIKNFKSTYKKLSKKEKGDRYEAYVAKYFREQGCYVWEHGKEKGVKDSNIDLFVKKDKYIYFIQCKDWATWKIDHNKVKATRMDVREYLETNQEFWKLIKNYDLKILYVTSKECLTPGAYKYIQEHKDIVDYQVIPIEE